jgi:TetR/AcrR family transcriptional regulator, mexJK operon transcriptional repressor
LALVGRKTTATLSEHKHRAIQQAGTDVFLRLGYGSASMDLIAAEAGVSKQTVYNHFQSKEALFKAIIENLTSTLMGPLVVRDPAKSTPEQVLLSLGRDFLGLMLRPSSLALYRLIVAESARFPELGGAIYAVGAGRLLAMLADYLAWETRNGRLAVSESELAAEQFIGMLSGRMQLRALLGVCTPPKEGELQRRVEHVVSCFLLLYAPRHSRATAARPASVNRADP